MSSSLTKVLAVGAVTAMALVGAPGAFAADSTATAEVSAGSRTAFLQDSATLAPIASSASATPVSIPLALTVDDTSGTRDGWNVTVEASDFVYSGDNGGSTIPASAFSIVPGTVTAPLGSEATVGGGGSLATPQTVLSAQESVNGEFTLPVEGTLVIPADSYVGTYTATLTTTISAAPVVP